MAILGGLHNSGPHSTIPHSLCDPGSSSPGGGGIGSWHERDVGICWHADGAEELVYTSAPREDGALRRVSDDATFARAGCKPELD